MATSATTVSALAAPIAAALQSNPLPGAVADNVEPDATRPLVTELAELVERDNPNALPSG